MESLIVTSRQDSLTNTERLTVERFPDRVGFDPYILDHARPGVLDIEADVVTVTVSNGTAVYHLRRDETLPSGTIPADLSYSSLEPTDG